MKRYCLALDLKDDEVLIAENEKMHREAWPEVISSIKNAAIDHLEIYRTGNRLFMILEAGDDFSFKNKAAMDAVNETVQKWEELMWKYQKALPTATPGEKWVLMNKIFQLENF